MSTSRTRIYIDVRRDDFYIQADKSEIDCDIIVAVIERLKYESTADL